MIVPALNISLILKGVIAIIMQIVIIRELLVVFNGNELTIGIILAIWLMLEAAGSGLLGKTVRKIKRIEETYILLQLITLFTLPLCILFARLSRNLFGLLPYELVNLFHMFLFSLLATAFFSLFDGMQFSLGCKLATHLNQHRLHAAGGVYILEAIGMLAGGVLFTFVLLPRFNSLQMVFILSFLNILSALFLGLAIQERKFLFTLNSLFLVVSIFIMTSGKIGLLQTKSLEYQWSNQQIVDYKNSVYGNIVVTQKGKQLTFFSNGTPLVVTPLPDISFVEQFAHIPLLFHPKPVDILVISGGVGGVINETLKHPVKKIDYAELDPLIIKKVQEFPDPLTQNELKNKKVNIISQDGRVFVNSADSKYDALLVNLPSPTTLQINRLYTVEFYQEAKRILNYDGILAIRLPGSLTYLNDELRQLNGCIYNSLKSVYKFVYAVPMDFNLYLASDSLDFSQLSLEKIAERFNERQLNTAYLTKFALRRQLDKTWQEWFYNSIFVFKQEKPNHDFSPRGMFLALTFFYSLAWPQAKSLFRLLSRIHPLFIIGAIVVLALTAIFSMQRMKKRIKLSIPLIIAMTGFAGISLELLILLGFEVMLGYLYYLIALLTAAFMFGLSVGGFIINANLKRFKDPLGVLIKLESAIMLFSIGLPLILFTMNKIAQPSLILMEKICFFVLSFTAGFLIGTEFPLANKIYSKQKEFMGVTAGSLYSFDLIGACLGAVLTAVVFMPVLGVFYTCVIIGMLKLSGVAFLIFAEKG